MNVLGDCELPIYTEEPKVFSGSTISVDYTVINIEDYDSEEDYRIAIVSKGDNGKSTFNVVESNCSGENFLNGYEACSICFTKQNYIPLYVETGRFVSSNNTLSLYLQNQDIKGTTITYGGAGQIRDVYMGNHVDSESENGDIIIEPNTTVEVLATNRVTIQSGLQCKLGGRLAVNKY